MNVNMGYQKNFDEKFYKYKNKKIAVYGTGQNARLIAEYVTGYNIIGFISGNQSDRLLEQPILTIEEAAAQSEVIIIAAVPSSTKIIFSRIKETIDSKITVVDLYGNILNQSNTYRDNPYWGKNFDMICAWIDRYDTISFDLFDTLIMRRVLKPSHIFKIAEKETELVGCMDGISLKKCRMRAEKICAERETTPSFDSIYAQMAIDISNISKKEKIIISDIVEKYKIQELKLEKKYIIPRNRMIAVYRYAKSKNKKIFLTTDMYFPKQLIQQLLVLCGIDVDEQLLISNVEHASKIEGDLYERLKEMAGDESVLHIGDHEEIDGTMAQCKGIDSFVIMSAYDILVNSSFVSIIDSIRTMDDQNYLGYFISEMLNDPFGLAETKGKLRLVGCRDLAQIIYPITMTFIHHIMRIASNYDCIIFPSRDGYFLYRLYKLFKKKKPECKLPEAQYLYSSRMALSRATVHDRESFLVLLDKLFRDRSLNCGEYIRNQFDIECLDEWNDTSGNLIDRWGEDGFKERIKVYCDEAIEKSKKNRQMYKRYLDSLNLNQYRSLAMVDIVSYGTQIYCLSELLNQKIDMIALGTTNIPNRYIPRSDQVKSVYGNVNEESGGMVYSCSNLSILHLFLELLYASYDGQFIGVSENEKPIFMENTEYNHELVYGVQKQLLNVIEEIEELGFQSENLSSDFSLEMMRLLLHENSDMDEELKKKFEFSDPYMGGIKKENLTDKL